MTPTQIESTYPPEVVAAWHWVKTYAPHRAKLNSDQQTYDGLTEDLAQQLDAHLETLRAHGLVRDAVYQPKLKPGMRARRPNFVVLEMNTCDAYCARCGAVLGKDSGPPDGWQIDDGTTVCQSCCISDLASNVSIRKRQ